jgi:hypothetical protein
MKAPVVKFESGIPEVLGKLVGSNWDACTLGDSIFFKKKKKDVSKELFKHEISHYRDFVNTYKSNSLMFFVAQVTEYLVFGYSKAPCEKRAKEYQKGSLTAEELGWWNSL